jgi:alpha-beta hydrolase superfamily lysophospholipase
LVLFKTIIFINQEEIMNPTKRALQSYHYDWLEKPLEHGMNIKKYVSKNETPYLLVSQNNSKGLSKRQELLAKQLGAFKPKAHKGVLVLLHGKNGRKEDLLAVAERYVSLDFTCLLLDLPHHGESKIKTLYYGTKKYEQHYVDEVLDDASQYISIDEPLYMWGMSLGGAFAIVNVANSKHTFRAMVLVSTFDSLDAVLKRKSTSIFGELFGDFLYQGLEKSLALLYDFHPSKVNSVKIAKSLDLPLYMVHGKKDTLIAHTQGKKLFDAFTSKKKVFYLDEDGDHHNILVTGHEFYKESGLSLLGEE